MSSNLILSIPTVVKFSVPADQLERIIKSKYNMSFQFVYDQANKNDRACLEILEDVYSILMNEKIEILDKLLNEENDLLVDICAGQIGA